MGICHSTKDEIDINYIEDKGMNEKHPHMLIYCKPFMRKNGVNFTCVCCNKEYNNIGNFHCIKCNYNICKECFHYTGGILYSKFSDGQKGKISCHQGHELIYKKSESRIKKSDINELPLYICNVCQCYFLSDYIKCWTCSKCNFNICDKCFRNSNGTVL